MSDLSYLRGKFITPYNYVSKSGETNFDDPMVETAGYVPAKRRIESLINAGLRLQQSRIEQYDFPDGKEDPSFFDPTRDPGFDLSDAAMLAAEAQSRMSAKVAQKTPSDASKPVLDVTPGAEKKPDLS